ncbi:MAG: glyoxalase [Chloroflexi bacterium]|nr:glyoxalase [Chloroflexota bacterium]
MTENHGRATFAPAVFYKDPKAAVAWLGQAFGFETIMLITGPDDRLQHCEMAYGHGYIMIGDEWTGWAKSPRSVDGANTQTTEVHVGEEIDAHCARARAAGAVIVGEPDDQFYGDRTYRAVDPEGHVWTFSQTIRHVSREEAEQASGLKIEGWV